MRLKRLFQFLCALVLCLQLCGGHLGMLQVVAWTGMWVRYVPTEGMVEATRKTFDGDHKCTMCHAIDAAREVEQEQGDAPKLPMPEWSKLGKELVFSVPFQLPALRWLECHQSAIGDPAWTGSADPVSPPVPPPRAA